MQGRDWGRDKETGRWANERGAQEPQVGKNLSLFLSLTWRLEAMWLLWLQAIEKDKGKGKKGKKGKKGVSYEALSKNSHGMKMVYSVEER